MAESSPQRAQDGGSESLDQISPSQRDDMNDPDTIDKQVFQAKASGGDDLTAGRRTPDLFNVAEALEKDAVDPSDSSTTTPVISPSETTSMSIEKQTWNPAPSIRDGAPSPSLSAYPAVELKRHRRNRYAPARQTKYLNNLMLIVGLLEFTNSLDFPANVWNMRPVPTFAVALMATCGSVCILASIYVFCDLHLSVRNFKLLRGEREYLQQQMARLEEMGDSKRKSMTQAYLDLNFREAVWELAERTLLISLNGFSGILVGVGTILAIDGANPVSFKASNLLSGYLGNSFNVVYAAANTTFAVYMYLCSRKYDRAIRAKVQSSQLKQRMGKHLRRHKIYAVVNGLTAFVAAIGSMVSAEHWQGYVVLIPCVIGALFCNLFWRHVVGYDRSLCQRVPDYADIDAEKKLVFAIDAVEQLKENRADAFLEKKSAEEILRFMADNDMQEDFTARLLHDAGNAALGLASKSGKKHFQVDYQQLNNLDEGILRRSARHVLESVGPRRFKDQESKYSELWGCQLAQESDRRGSVQVPYHATKDEV